MEELIFIFGGFMFIIAAVGLVFYVLSSLGLMRLAQNRGIENPWLAWIPYANMFIIGRVAGDEITVFNYTIHKLSLVLLIGSLVMTVISYIPFIGFLLVVAFAIVIFHVYYKIFAEIKPESATLYLVLSILVPGALSVILFMLSKQDDNNIQY